MFYEKCKNVIILRILIERVAKEVPEAPMASRCNEEKKNRHLWVLFLPINDDKRTEELTELQEKSA